MAGGLDVDPQAVEIAASRAAPRAMIVLRMCASVEPVVAGLTVWTPRLDGA
jgi:hypothetical protein